MFRVSYLIVAATLALAPATSRAAELKYRLISYLTKSEVKPVGDAEGHVAGAWERRGLCLFPKNEVGTYLASGTSDMTQGKGTARGQSSCAFADGSGITSTFTVSIEPTPDKLQLYTGKSEMVSGTGRYQGIKGTTTFTGRSYTPGAGDTKSDNVLDVVAKYTLPKK